MSQKVLIYTLSGLFKSVVTGWAHCKTYYTSSVRLAAKLSGTLTDGRKKNKNRGVTKLIFPQLADSVREGWHSIASFYITNSAVSWAKMSCTKELLEWEVIDIPHKMDKIHLSTIYETVLKIINLLPKADLYVMEEMGTSRQSSSGAILANLYLLQFRAIMLAYLNKFEGSCEEFDMSQNNKVYFLRSRVVAHLSSTLVGSEKVSVEKIVTNILNIPGHTGSCPQYSPINVDWTLKQKYMLKESVDRENMGQALLIIMTFIDLIITRRPQSIQYIAR